MTQATATWPIGNFKATVTADLTQQQLEACATFAIKYLAQRAKIDRALGIQVKEGNKWVMKGKRGEVEFSEEHAKALADLFSVLTDDDENPTVSISALATVVENEREKADVKWKAERAKIAEKGGDTDKLEALAEAVSFDGFEQVSELTVDNTEFCAAIRAYVKKLTAGI